MMMMNKEMNLKHSSSIEFVYISDIAQKRFQSIVANFADLIFVCCRYIFGTYKLQLQIQIKIQKKHTNNNKTPNTNTIANANCRYIFGTDKLRPNAFEVRGMDGSNTGKYHSSS